MCAKLKQISNTDVKQNRIYVLITIGTPIEAHTQHKTYWRDARAWRARRAKDIMLQEGAIYNSQQKHTMVFAILLGRAGAADGDLTRMVYIVSGNARHRTDGVYAKDLNAQEQHS